MEKKLNSKFKKVCKDDTGELTELKSKNQNYFASH